MKITLKDGSIMEVESGLSCYEVAKTISEGLARAAVAAVVDGKKVEAAAKLFKQPYKLGAGDKHYERLTVDIPETAPQSVDYELVISGTGSYLGLCEVSFEKK